MQREACFSLGFAFWLQQQILNIPTINWIKTTTIIRTTKKAAAMATPGTSYPTVLEPELDM